MDWGYVGSHRERVRAHTLEDIGFLGGGSGAGTRDRTEIDSLEGRFILLHDAASRCNYVKNY